MQYHDAGLVPGSVLADTWRARVEQSLRSRRPQTTIAMQAGAIAQCDTRAALARLPRRLPVLLIQGKLDRMVDYEESRILEAHLPQVRRYVPPAGDAFGHMWFDYFDRDTAWVRPLSAFLDAPPAKL